LEQVIFEIKEIEKKDGYAKFDISPLVRGYGNTLGTALRRVLLTSLPGAAIVSARISKVKHQFSTLAGMKEDVTEFLLNVKKIRISYDGDDPVKLSLDVSGAGEVKAADIKTPANVAIVNPELVLANLAKDAKLSAEFEVECGVGYSPSEERESGTVGVISLDAVFSPVTRVNFKIEETRVGRITNFDRLILEIWTDGTIKPADALKRAAATLVSYFEQIVSPKKVVKEEKEEANLDATGGAGRLSVEEIGLPTRVANALIKSGYETVEKLAGADRAALMKVRNLGEKSIKTIEAAMGEKGIRVKYA